MTLENLNTRQELRDLIDAYAILGDERKISEQMNLFTKDANYKVYMNGQLLANTLGTDTLEKEFRGHASQVKTYFTLNGQHTVALKGDTATGVSFTQIKMIRETEGKDVLTDYSVRYDDNYVHRDGKWLIKARTGHFMIIEARSISN
ncbi:nuclear transport factor 2 family protein [Pedobacter foliorum]|uniref:nuclear transport factor 2 family protein n=1 Tax=Pedobacter foliorum TaxID=2739058 RepID=UPI0015656210|nr:nuclear transport factor 2 family protein [Pedobacter foliorum]NRF37522.1 nuclear transport factor 2 family protein [Pedobacter foliorum]